MQYACAGSGWRIPQPCQLDALYCYPQRAVKHGQPDGWLLILEQRSAVPLCPAIVLCSRRRLYPRHSEGRTLPRLCNLPRAASVRPRNRLRCSVGRENDSPKLLTEGGGPAAVIMALERWICSHDLLLLPAEFFTKEQLSAPPGKIFFKANLRFLAPFEEGDKHGGERGVRGRDRRNRRKSPKIAEIENQTLPLMNTDNADQKTKFSHGGTAVW